MMVSRDVLCPRVKPEHPSRVGRSPRSVTALSSGHDGKDRSTTARPPEGLASVPAGRRQLQAPQVPVRRANPCGVRPAIWVLRCCARSTRRPGERTACQAWAAGRARHSRCSTDQVCGGVLEGKTRELLELRLLVRGKEPWLGERASEGSRRRPLRRHGLHHRDLHAFPIAVDTLRLKAMSGKHRLTAVRR